MHNMNSWRDKMMTYVFNYDEYPNTVPSIVGVVIATPTASSQRLVNDSCDVLLMAGSSGQHSWLLVEDRL